MSSKWENTAKEMWEAILAHVRTLREQGCTLQDIAERIGVAHRAQISEWLSGSKRAEKTTFAQMMEYLERSGLDYRTFLPQDAVEQPTHPAPTPAPAPDSVSSKELAALRARIMELEREIGETRTERDKAIGQVELLKEQLATESAKKDAASAERVSFPATRGSTRAG